MSYAQVHRITTLALLIGAITVFGALNPSENEASAQTLGSLTFPDFTSLSSQLNGLQPGQTGNIYFVQGLGTDKVTFPDHTVVISLASNSAAPFISFNEEDGSYNTERTVFTTTIQPVRFTVLEGGSTGTSFGGNYRINDSSGGTMQRQAAVVFAANTAPTTNDYTLPVSLRGVTGTIPFSTLVTDSVDDFDNIDISISTISNAAISPATITDLVTFDSGDVTIHTGNNTATVNMSTVGYTIDADAAFGLHVFDYTATDLIGAQSSGTITLDIRSGTSTPNTSHNNEVVVANSLPTGDANIASTAVYGRTGTLDFSQVRDNTDSFEDLNIVIAFTPDTLLGDNIILQEGYDTTADKVTAQTVTYNVPRSITAGSYPNSGTYTVTDSDGGTFTGTLSFDITKNTDELTGIDVTRDVTISSLSSRTGVPDPFVISQLDLALEIYNNTETLDRLGLTVDDLPNVSVSVPEQDKHGFVFLSPGSIITLGNIAFNSTGTVSFDIVITLNDDNHDRNSGDTVSITYTFVEECLVDTSSGISFGELYQGQTSAGTNRINTTNIGNLDAQYMISGQDWTDSADQTQTIMHSNQTIWSLASTLDNSNTFNSTDIAIGEPVEALAFTRNAIAIFLQLTIDLIDDNFTGAAMQQLDVTSMCN